MIKDNEETVKREKKVSEEQRTQSSLKHKIGGKNHRL